ncbi:MAG TPA: M48 family metalloprotease, partial [Mycobacteriales bacterium]|nr:M48 family metalloprotease [Mycobacteriales bacterium]
ATAGLVVVVSFAYPLVVEPVFNRFTPLAAGPLRDDLLALAEREGVQVDDVLVADASRRTTALNAYVSGFGSTRRIVVHDTLLAQASDAEVRLVVAHELAHAENRDVLTGTLLGALAAAAAVVALALLLSWTPLLRRAGVEGPGDPRAVALVLALTALGGFLAGPVSNLVSRRVEARADVASLDLTRDPQTFVEAQRRLALANLSDLEPSRVLRLLFATHPSTTERIATAREWERLRG